MVWETADRICGKWLKAALPHLVESIGGQPPFPVKGIDPDNNSVFINDTLTQYCAGRGIEFTRSRPYRKNDQGMGSHPAHRRIPVAKAPIADLAYDSAPYQLVEKTRHGSRVVKRHSPPATPCDRLMRHDALSVEMKAALSEYQARLNPVALLHAIREAQSALAPDMSPEIRPTTSGKSLEQFLAKLPDLWRQDAAHTSRERRVQPPRTWRTRPDPFEGVRCDVLSWLQEDPDAKAIALLNSAHPDRFRDTDLRTLQRRVQQWGGIMGKKLVYAEVDEPVPELPAVPELAPVGAGPQVLKFQ